MTKSKKPWVLTPKRRKSILRASKIHQIYTAEGKRRLQNKYNKSET